MVAPHTQQRAELSHITKDCVMCKLLVCIGHRSKLRSEFAWRVPRRASAQLHESVRNGSPPRASFYFTQTFLMLEGNVRYLFEPLLLIFLRQFEEEGYPPLLKQKALLTCLKPPSNGNRREAMGVGGSVHHEDVPSAPVMLSEGCPRSGQMLFARRIHCYILAGSSCSSHRQLLGRVRQA